jgi:hypothetical protein
MSAAAGTSVDQAWQQALAAENEAVFGYGVLGPRLTTAAAVALAHTCQDEHDALRAATEATLAGRGQQPVAPPADYPDLAPVATPGAAAALATTLEQRAASAWRRAYAAAAMPGATDVAALRVQAQSALSASAVRATRWRMLAGAPAPTVAFPGI